MAQRIFTNQVFSNTGIVGVGFKINFFETGTTTPRDTFSDITLTIANTNPIIADANGRFIDVFVDDITLYKSVLTNTNDNTLETLDPIDPQTFSLNDFDPRPLSLWGLTAGDANNYTLAADPTITENENTHIFAVTIHVDCNAGCDLSIDDLSIKDLKKYDGAGGKVDLEDGDLQANQRYFVTDDGVDFVVFNPESKNTLIISDGGELTIDSGEIIITGSRHTIDTEGDASTDDLDTINGLTAGQTLILSIEDNTRPAVLTNNGNIITPNGIDITLRDINDRLIINYDGTNAIVSSTTRRPGQIVQVVNVQDGTLNVITPAVIPFDNTIPQSNEGGQIMSLSITPTNSNNKLKIDVIAVGRSNSNVCDIIALFRDNEINALAVGSSSVDFSASACTNIISYPHLTLAGTDSLLTFKVRAGGNSGNYSFNGDLSGNAIFGGTAASSITITEIQT